VVTGLLGLFVFGSVLEESVLTNVGGLGNWQSFLLRIIFLVVLVAIFLISSSLEKKHY